MAGMGEILSALRKQKGVTQGRDGQTLGISMRAVSRWETARAGHHASARAGGLFWR